MMVHSLIVSDVFETYTYFYIDETTKHGFLIDPGAEADKLLTIIADNSWTIEAILLTHGHFDHTGAVETIHQTLQIPYYIHENGVQYLENPQWNLSTYCERYSMLTEATYVRDGDMIALAANPSFSVKVLHTPGHTTDSVTYYSESDKIAFVGDTIFKGSIGSIEYHGSYGPDLQKSILDTIFQLPSDVTMYSGHSEWTTVGAERARCL